jgi:DNA excision repair protein ERCC-3
MNSSNPLIVQGDRSLLLHTTDSVTHSEGRPLPDEAGNPQTAEHPRFREARDRLAAFAELEKSPEYLHSYRITPVTVWNAAAIGMQADEIVDTLEDLSCVPLPPNVLVDIREWCNRYGRFRIERDGDDFVLTAEEPGALDEVLGFPSVAKLLTQREDGAYALDGLHRGVLKQALIRIGFPVDDRGGYLEGDRYAIELRTETASGSAFGLRPYQDAAAEAFHQGGAVTGGNGVVVLPCGAGKTIVAMGVMQRVGAKTLILTTNTVAVRQWREEILDKTTLGPDEVGEYTGESKTVAPVTITTYQMLT